nr:MAG TPA: hypothetical protein [Bacteriophage sp.]
MVLVTLSLLSEVVATRYSLFGILLPNLSLVDFKFWFFFFFYLFSFSF